MMASDSQLQQVLNILRRRSLPMLVVALAGAALAGMGGLLVPPRYTAKAEIVIEPQELSPGAGQALVVVPEDQAAVQTQITALSSRDHLRRVLASLQQDPAFVAATPPANGGVTGAGRLSQTLRGWLKAQWLATGAPVMHAVTSWFAAEARLKPSPDAAADAALDAFQRKLLIFQERGSQAVAAQFSYTDPIRAALAANRVVQLFAQRQYDQKRENTIRTLSWIGTRIDQLKAELDRSEADVERYRTANALPASDQTDVVDARIVDINHDLAAAQGDLAGRQSRLAFIEDLQRRAAGGLPDSLDSPVLADLRHQDATLRQQVAEMAPLLGVAHPKVQQIAAQLREVDRRMGYEVGRTVGSLRDDARVAAARVQSLQDQLAAVQRAGAGKRAAEVRLRDLERQTLANRQLYDSLIARREQIREQQEMIAPDVRILSLATPPYRPSSASPVLMMLPAFVLCWLGGGLVAIGAERMNRGLRSARDVTDLLGIRCIGLVPRIRTIGRMRPHRQLMGRRFTAYAEAIRSLVATLQLASPQRAPRVVLVTSSVPREGKTTLAVSFAVYAAMIGRRVVLVDLDFRKPAIMREIGGETVAARAGTESADDLSLEAVRTIPGLHLDVLPLRSPPDDPLTPFANGRLPRLVSVLRAQYDLVVIDGPPQLGVTEAQLLTAMADRILFAVRWGKTRRDVALNVINRLRDARLLGDELATEMLAAVVTQVNMRRHASYRLGDIGEPLVAYKPVRIAFRGSALQRLGFVRGGSGRPVADASAPAPTLQGD